MDELDCFRRAQIILYTVLKKLPHFYHFRVRLLRQPRKRAGCHPGHERLSGRHQEAEGPAEEVQGRFQTVLDRAQRRRRKGKKERKRSTIQNEAVGEQRIFSKLSQIEI
jgi:hypothetical protein